MFQVAVQFLVLALGGTLHHTKAMACWKHSRRAQGLIPPLHAIFLGDTDHHSFEASKKTQAKQAIVLNPTEWWVFQQDCSFL